MSNNCIVVTGGSGQIGGALVRRLIADNSLEVIVVEDKEKHPLPPNGILNKNFISKDKFILEFDSIVKEKNVTAIVHMGAISSTTELNVEALKENNYEYTCHLLDLCRLHNVYLIFASSASVYGNNKDNSEKEENESPLNAYAQSKLDVDNYIRAMAYDSSFNSQVTSLRFFNVSGPDESHKVGQCSPFYTYLSSLIKNGHVNILSGDDGHGNRAHLYSRDFIYTEDVVDVVFWALKNKKDGIFNVGTGQSSTFKSVASACISAYKKKKDQIKSAGIQYYDSIEVVYVPFPEHLKGKSQPYTKADISKLREAGYDKQFIDTKALAESYVDWIIENKDIL